ncbi:hypothetical protein MIND_01412400 [Mycena indigotica]|uniref:F-box domain-containing protein n=1 Tax=Mycena indigotica TaxID=2126181 RepID=A0A8H6RXZ8_9AGAR|nr:uncharacterized protein MIND_01412400 [Mycena indigotica]KAF7288958.1 hypothetical protein MIND_01412400 [Mycena indigotica]
MKWQIVNLDKHQALVTGATLQDLLFSEAAQGLARHLCVSTLAVDEIVLPYRAGDVIRLHGVSMRLQHAKVQRAALLELPEEILREVLGQVDEFVELFLFSTTCQTLWYVGRHIIFGRLCDPMVTRSWAGDRLVCVPDTASLQVQAAVYPEHLRQPLVKALRKAAPEPLPLAVNPDVAHLIWTLWNDSERRVRIAHPAAPRAFRAALSDTETLCAALVADSAIRHAARIIKQHTQGVLRNVSKRKYIRAAVVARFAASRGITDAGYASVLLPWLCWAPAEPDLKYALTAEGKSRALHNGQWAGDHFDVLPEVMSRAWTAGGEAESWTDVTDEALSLMERIWTAEESRTDTDTLPASRPEQWHQTQLLEEINYFI